jgi:hypothetical protein
VLLDFAMETAQEPSKSALETYLEATDTSDAAFGRQVVLPEKPNGVTGMCVYKWKKKQTMPNRASRIKIEEITAGAVPAASFL